MKLLQVWLWSASTWYIVVIATLSYERTLVTKKVVLPSFVVFWLFSERFIWFPRQYLFVGSERRAWVQFSDDTVVALLDNMVMIIEHAHAELGLPGCNVDLHFEAEVPVRWDCWTFCWNIGGGIWYLNIYISIHIWNNFMAKKMVRFSLNHPILKLCVNSPLSLQVGLYFGTPGCHSGLRHTVFIMTVLTQLFAGNLHFYVPPLQALCCRFDPIHENHFRLILCVRVLARAVEGNENCICNDV